MRKNSKEEIEQLTREQLIARWEEYGHHIYETANTEDIRKALIAFCESVDTCAVNAFHETA